MLKILPQARHELQASLEQVDFPLDFMYVTGVRGVCVRDMTELGCL